MNGRYINFINAIKCAIISKRNIIYIYNNKFIMSIIIVLKKYLYINKFRCYYRKVIVYLNLFMLCDIKVISKGSRMVFVSYKSIIIDSKEILIISTTYGIMCDSMVVKRKLGGVSLFSIKNV